MAITAAAATQPLLTAEANPSAVTSPTQRPEDLAPNSNHPSNTPLRSPELQTMPSAAPSSPAFTRSINELKDLSTAIISFQQCYEDLQNHLDSIRAAILSKLPLETLDAAVPLSLSPTVEKLDVSAEKVFPVQQEQDQNSPKSELEGLCKTMCSRGIRKYLVTHLSDLPKLREEVPRALKLAPNPGKLVLECSGKFFLQGSKAFTKDSPMIPSRDASIFILECFLLMMGISGTGNGNGVEEIEKSVRQEAETAALAWRKRLVAEGGVAKCNQVDARGLLLFVACFGIPYSFKREDIRDLIAAANAKEIVSVLKNSGGLMVKIPEIVEGMLKNKMEVDAVDIVYTFGLEERFNPQTILISFLRESKEYSKKSRKASQGSGVPLKEANKKQLAALKSIRRCLERHKIDAAKLLPGWQISEKISTLEKDIADFDRKAADRTAQKRKASESSEASRKSKNQESKRSRYTSHNPQQQKISGHVDSRRNLLETGRPGHAVTYSASPSVVYGGPGAGLLPESMLPSGVVTRGGVLSTGSYSGVHEGMMVDSSAQVMNRGSQSNVWMRDAALVEKYASQPPPVGLTSLYRQSTSVEGFAGVPSASSVGHGVRTSASADLYHFADAVAESESYPRSVAAMTNAVPSHHSSYLYQV